MSDYGQIALQEGLELYNQGDYVSAYRRLEESPDIDRASIQVRTEALKYMAFAACAQNKRTSCRQAFERLLALQPGFELKESEAKHPVWGAIFKQVQQAQARRR